MYVHESLGAIERVGTGLSRPESVICTASGRRFCADAEHLVQEVGDDATTPLLTLGVPQPFLANGIALLEDGAFLIANLGDEGGVWRRHPDGALIPFLLEVEGTRLPPTNFVGVDAAGRIWVTVSTRLVPRDLAFDGRTEDGFIVLVDDRGARVAADGLGFTNEAHVDPAGTSLYVNETVARRLSRFPIRDDGGLGARETVVDFEAGTYPDGFAFDAEGGVWIASVVSNRLVRVAPDGSQTVFLEDQDPEVLREVDARHATGRFSRADIDRGAERELANISSVAFGGPDLQTVYLGSLAGASLLTCRAPIAGHPPPHWTWL